MSALSIWLVSYSFFWMVTSLIQIHHRSHHNFKTNTDWLGILVSKQQNPFYSLHSHVWLIQIWPSLGIPSSPIWTTSAQVVPCLLNLYIKYSTIYISRDLQSTLVVLLILRCFSPHIEMFSESSLSYFFLPSKGVSYIISMEHIIHPQLHQS